MSPGSVTVRVAFFVAECASHDRISARGGLESDGEDIEIVEIAFENAVKMVKTGEIMDAKAIMLLQYAQLEGLFDASSASPTASVLPGRVPRRWLGETA